VLTGLSGDIARRAAKGGGLFVPSRPLHDDVLGHCLGAAGRLVARNYPPESTIEAIRRIFDERVRAPDYLSWMSYVALKTKLVEDYLQRLDKMGMRHSVEGRVPLLDPSLASWALRLPQETKAPGFNEKALLRRAVAPILPAYVLNRPKQGFCPPVGAWSRNLLSSRPAAIADPLITSGLLDRDGLLRLEKDGGRQPFAVWTVRLLIEWANKNMSSARVADPVAA